MEGDEDRNGSSTGKKCTVAMFVKYGRKRRRSHLVGKNMWCQKDRDRGTRYIKLYIRGSYPVRDYVKYRVCAT